MSERVLRFEDIGIVVEDDDELISVIEYRGDVTSKIEGAIEVSDGQVIPVAARLLVTLLLRKDINLEIDLEKAEEHVKALVTKWETFGCKCCGIEQEKSNVMD